MTVRNVLLLQLDGKLMNLALGKLLAWYLALGARVELRHAANWSAVQPRLGDPVWDRVYGSLIFERTRPLAERVRKLYPQIELGGTGWDFIAGVQVSRTELPAEIEALRPSYAGWPKMTSSLGYTHRGCRLACGFCVIPRKEGKIRPIGSLRDVWRLYTAWDGKNDEKRLFRGLEALKRHGVLPNRIMVYMLIGYDRRETHESRDYRRRKLREFGCRPYPMPYLRGDDAELDAELKMFKGWCIQRKDEFVPWDAWVKAHGNPRRLGTRRVSLPLFPELEPEPELDDDDPSPRRISAGPVDARSPSARKKAS